MSRYGRYDEATAPPAAGKFLQVFPTDSMGNSRSLLFCLPRGTYERHGKETIKRSIIPERRGNSVDLDHRGMIGRGKNGHFDCSCNIEGPGLENRVLLHSSTCRVYLTDGTYVARPRDLAENISWFVPDPRISASGFTARSAEKSGGLGEISL